MTPPEHFGWELQTSQRLTEKKPTPVVRLSTTTNIRDTFA
jgi:hypothetical protein